MTIFDLQKWTSELPVLSRQYQDADPFPHIALAPFFLPDKAQAIASEFPRRESPVWNHHKHINCHKLSCNKKDAFAPSIRTAIEELNSSEFLNWLSGLTGIGDLLADPILEGGGLHQVESGGHLNIHADFTRHHKNLDLCRRINLIVYLNPSWKEAWGGAIEFWDKQMRSCRAKVLPLMNQAIIFSTNETSYHGHPELLACPPDILRKSIALYYYTLDQARINKARSTTFMVRPTDSGSKAFLIWLDNQAVACFSMVKQWFGISDESATRVLGIFDKVLQRLGK